MTTGPFRFSRNSIYVGGILAVLGEALLFEAVSLFGYALGLRLFFHSPVVYVEEPRLRARFGTDYDAYCDRVPRWLPLRR